MIARRHVTQEETHPVNVQVNVERPQRNEDSRR
jgi:hypothetical protein